jgi:hypothetical protein
MKSTIAFFVLLVLLAGTGFNCRRTGIPLRVTTIKGKIVYVGCSTDVIQVLEGTVDTAHLAKTWKFYQTDSTYTNVFSVGNYCDFRNLGFKVNDVLTFTIKDTTAVNSCVECLVFDGAPRVYDVVSNVKKIN